MISVRFHGHIRTAMGREEVGIARSEMSVGELIDAVRSMAKGGERPGFSRFNTLVVVNGGEVLPASQDGRQLRDGDEVLLVPFSHGG
jgi:molybdopterin converting factor small subunit